MSLDPRSNRLRREAKKDAAKKAPRLNPPPPWQPLAFDPFEFGLQNDPPKPPAARQAS